MSSKKTTELNVSSMADIAFLLLIFFLMVTTIEEETGILRVLPPPITETTKHKDNEVLQVLVNMHDEILVEGEVIKISQLKEKAKTFLFADGIFIEKEKTENFLRKWVRKNDVIMEIASIKEENDSEKNQLKMIQLEKQLLANNQFGKDYKRLPNGVVISIQNNINTTYNQYINVQNELQAALNELRNELSMEVFNISYTDMKSQFERNRNNKSIATPLKEKMYAIQAVYPSRISEAPPTSLRTLAD